jgi:hypothetical protein
MHSIDVCCSSVSSTIMYARYAVMRSHAPQGTSESGRTFTMPRLASNALSLQRSCHVRSPSSPATATASHVNSCWQGHQRAPTSSQSYHYIHPTLSCLIADGSSSPRPPNSQPPQSQRSRHPRETGESGLDAELASEPPHSQDGGGRSP